MSILSDLPRSGDDLTRLHRALIAAWGALKQVIQDPPSEHAAHEEQVLASISEGKLPETLTPLVQSTGKRLSETLSIAYGAQIAPSVFVVDSYFNTLLLDRMGAALSGLASDLTSAVNDQGALEPALAQAIRALDLDDRQRLASFAHQSLIAIHLADACNALANIPAMRDAVFLGLLENDVRGWRERLPARVKAVAVEAVPIALELIVVVAGAQVPPYIPPVAAGGVRLFMDHILGDEDAPSKTTAESARSDLCELDAALERDRASMDSILDAVMSQ